MKFSIFKTFLLSLLMVAQVHFAYAQTASILPPAKTTFVDQNGKPLTYGTVDFYIPSTTTRKTTWQDAAETIPNLNPVRLDGAGRALILGSGTYRQVVKDRNANVIWDQLTSSVGSGGGGTSGTGDGDLVGTVKPWAGMVSPNQYLFTYGQEISRTTYAVLFTAITSTQSVFCNTGSPILSGVGDTTNFWVGMPVEVSCLATGFSTIISKTSSSVTLAANANVTVSTAAVFFPWGRGNGTTTFNLPDFRGFALAGNNNMGGTAAANLTTTYFGSTNPNSSGAAGGSQSSSIALALANLPTGITSSGNNSISVTSTQGVLKSGTDQAVQSAGAAFAFSAGQTTSTLTSTNTTQAIAVTSNNTSGTPLVISNVPPEKTVNYIIKVTPDSLSSVSTGVTSLGSMVGDIACGTGLLCTGNIISASTVGTGSPLSSVNDTNVTLTLGGTPLTALLQSVSITAGWTGNLAVGRGGTGIASGTSGGIPYFSSTSTIASSALLTANQIMLGGGAGAAPVSLGALGTTTTILHGNAGGAPSFGSIVAADVAANTLTNATLATMAANTIKANATGGAAAPTDVSIPALTQKVSPVAADKIMIADSAASDQLKYATVSSISSAGSVASLNGQTGALVSYFPPQGRLTLTSLTPVMTTSVAAAATVYYTPYGGNMVPIYDGTNIIPTVFAEVSQATTDATKSPAAATTNSNYDIFCWVDTGPTNRCTRGPVWTNDTTRSAGTALTLVNGIYLNNASITNGPAASRGTWVGTIRTNGTSTVDYTFGALAAGGTAGSFGVWNAYNRVDVATVVRESTDSWSYAVSSTWRAPNASATMRVSFVRGLDEDAASAIYAGACAAGSATICLNGVGLDSTTAFSGTTGPNAAAVVTPTSGIYSGLPGLGFHFLSAIEANNTATASTFYGDIGIPTLVQTGFHVRLRQ